MQIETGSNFARQLNMSIVYRVKSTAKQGYHAIAGNLGPDMPVTKYDEFLRG